MHKFHGLRHSSRAYRSEGVGLTHFSGRTLLTKRQFASSRGDTRWLMSCASLLSSGVDMYEESCVTALWYITAD